MPRQIPTELHDWNGGMLDRIAIKLQGVLSVKSNVESYYIIMNNIVFMMDCKPVCDLLHKNWSVDDFIVMILINQLEWQI